MAELPKDIRKPSGELVAPKRPYGRRLLLPTEVELCNLLGLTEDEYWFFVEKTAAYNGQRPKGYELIPDIRCDPVTAWVSANIVNIGIAIVAAAISYALTPKPKEPKSGGSRRTADAIGNSRFAPQASFNSVQELAQIGDAIPLIFADQVIEIVDGNEIVYGGIRVNSQLLWSQFVSLGRYQQLKALALFSHGTIGDKPDYNGFAVGDTLLSTYNAYKANIYFKDGSNSDNNRIVKTDKYIESKLILSESQDLEDPFEVGVPNLAGTKAPTSRSKAFSGARNPTTQVAFGVYSPLPNAQICRLPYELIRDPKGSEKESIRDMMKKRKKVEFARWPVRAGVLRINGIETKGVHSVNEGDTIVYQIVGIDGKDESNGLQRVYDSDPDTKGSQEVELGDAFNYRPHGVQDVDNLTTTIRERTDSVLSVGEQYLFGTAVVICSAHNDPAPWTIEKTKAYFFKVIEAGEVDIPMTGANLSPHCQNPIWYEPPEVNDNWKKGVYSLSDFGPVFYRQVISGESFAGISYGRGERDLYHGHDIYTGYRIAMATVSNNRRCHVTEIGIKSNVWKKIRFANVNSQPNEAALQRAFNDSTQIQLGQVDTFGKRISLFMLQARRKGGTNWEDLLNTLDQHTGLFAVKGNTNEAQYNAITISHPELGQYDFRFKPYPGNYITRRSDWNKRFNLLSTDGAGVTQINHFSADTSFGMFDVAFSGNEGYTIDEDEASNPEWQLGTVSVGNVGTIIDAKSTENGQTRWVEDPNFNGAITSCEWKPFVTHTDGSYAIVLWNEVTNPQWAAVYGHQWSLYRPNQAEVTSSVFSNNNTSWPQVSFSQSTPERQFRPANPDVYYHLQDNNHYFHVTEYRWTCAESVAEKFVHSQGSVAVTGGSGTGLRVNLKIQKQNINEGKAGFPASYVYEADWSLDLNSLGNGEYKNGDIVYIPWTDVDNNSKTIQVKLTVSVRQITTEHSQNFNPFDALADWNVYEGDENSNRSEPEHQLVYVNEILKPPTNTDDVEQPAKYSNLAFAGIKINSSKEWTNFSQFSAYFKKGIKIEKLNLDGMGPHQSTGASNLFPEIAHSLLTNSEIGAGKLVGSSSVDRPAMANAADFCKKNKFFWDGTISSKLNLRDFIFEHAGYCLLDFTIVGGKFSLKPSVPVNSKNEIDRTELPDIKCLFTDGNISDLKISFLSPEERQTFKAAVLYRSETINGFPETKSLLIREQVPDGSETDPVETFDLSGFCTSRQQALWFACFAIKSRRLVDHGLSFKTAPQYVEGLSPGDYFRLVSEVSHTSRFRNGAKLEDGTIVSKDDVASSESVLYWEPGTVGVKFSTLGNAPNGVLFTVKNTTTENKVYKCETISYGEDGLIEVAGSYAPVEPSTLDNGDPNPIAGQLSVMQHWGFDIDDLSSFHVIEE